MVTIPDALAGRVRATLAQAAPGHSGIAPAEWRRRRDGLIDCFDPTRDTEPTVAELRMLIDLLAESGPRRDARVPRDRWSVHVDDVIADLLGAAG